MIEESGDVHSVFFHHLLLVMNANKLGKGKKALGKISIPFVTLRSDSPLCFWIKAN